MSQGPGAFARRFPGFSLRVTGLTLAFTAAVLVLAVAALNTGNNALYLLLALSLGAFVASGALSRHTLGHLEVQARLRGEVFAAAPVRLELTVTNTSSWLPATVVTCRLHGAPGWTVVPRVEPGERVAVMLPTVFRRRGEHSLPPVRLEVRTPLPFFLKAIQVRQSGRVLVYPRRVPGADGRWGGLGADRWQEGRRTGGGRGGEVEQLREFHSGDDRRDIHWKQTARQQRLIVKERRDLRSPARFLVLDRQLPRRGDPELLERFEDVVSEVASVALRRMGRGEAVGLVVGGTVRTPGRGGAHARTLLRDLALVAAVGPGEDPVPHTFAHAGVYRLAGRP